MRPNRGQLQSAAAHNSQLTEQLAEKENRLKCLDMELNVKEMSLQGMFYAFRLRSRAVLSRSCLVCVCVGVCERVHTLMLTVLAPSGFRLQNSLEYLEKS